MSATSADLSRNSRGQESYWEQVATLSSLWALAVTQPTLDVVGNSPSYWIASRVEPNEVILISILAVVVPTVAIAFMTSIFRLTSLSRTVWNRFAFPVCMTGLLAVAVFYAASRALGKPTWLAMFCTVIGAAGAWAFRHSVAFRRLTTWSAVTIVLVPINFLILGPTRTVVSSEARTTGAVPAESRAVLQNPLIVVVFDELGLPVLLDENGAIDKSRYPNFARLATTSTWFRSTTTNYGSTEKSLPAIITGNLQESEGAASSYRQNPTNLFTMVHAPTGVFAYELLTQMCPPNVCTAPEEGFSANRSQVIADLWLIYQNVMVPDFLRAEIRPLPERWSNLAGESAVEEDPAELEKSSDSLMARESDMRVDAFCGELRPERSQSLFFLHVMAPHAPYDRNPDGSSYHRAAGYDMIGWIGSSNSWRVDAGFQTNQAFQRYVSQVIYSDKLLGRIISKLEQTDMFERSHLVVLADHGVSFEPGLSRRPDKMGPAPQVPILSVPLFWKLPGQSVGSVSDRSAELIDILPTILSETGESEPKDLDGTSLFSDKQRNHRTFGGKQYHLNPWPEVLRIARSRANVVQTFFERGFPYPVEYAKLIGAEIDDFEISNTPRGLARLERPEVLDEIADAREFDRYVPNFIEGDLSDDSIERLAVTLDRTIVDVVEPLQDGDRTRFSSFFNPEFLRKKKGELRLFAVDLPDLGSTSFAPIETKRFPFGLVDRNIRDESGKSLLLVQERLISAVSAVQAYEGQVHVYGWMGDRRTFTAPEAFIASYGDHQFGSRHFLPRPDLANIGPGMTMAGFKFELSLDDAVFDPHKLVIYAIFDSESYAEATLPDTDAAR